MKLFSWIKSRLTHKWKEISRFFNINYLIDFIKEHGVVLLIIVIGWEIVEDLLFPVLFVWLGAHVHPIFIAGAPLSVLLCVHWLAVPVLWGFWTRIRGEHTDGPGI